MNITPCPNCDSEELYQSHPVSAGGGYAPNYLPGLGGFFCSGKFEIVVCSDCGLTRFFATGAAREKVALSGKWKRVENTR